MHTLYEEYASVEAQIRDLEDQKDKLRPMILEQMIGNGQETVGTAIGKFTVVKLKSWTYPERIVKLGERIKIEINDLTETLKAAQAKAQSTEEATFTEKEALRFTSIKL